MRQYHAELKKLKELKIQQETKEETKKEKKPRTMGGGGVVSSVSGEPRRSTRESKKANILHLRLY